jgi:hypothetical protein
MVARDLAGLAAMLGTGCTRERRRVFCAELCPADGAAVTVTMGLEMKEGRRDLLDITDSAMMTITVGKRGIGG